MLKPLREEQGVPVFNRNDIDLYGFPDCYGYTEWLCVDCDPDFVVENYDDFLLFEKKIHRYSRFDRFKMIFLQLLGWRGRVDDEVLEICDLIDFDWNNVWLIFKRDLKFNEKSKYYNRIPRILFLLGKWKMLDIDCLVYHRILERFKRLEYLFGLQTERKYFPSLRYTCLRLLAEEGIEHDFYIYDLLTLSRRKALDDFWEKYFLR